MIIHRLLALMAAATVALAACGGASAPALTDPKEILAKSLETLATVKTVHLSADVSGTFSVDLTGGGGSGSPLDLKGTSLAGDIDVAGKKVKLTASVPALMALTADMIVIGQDTYTKISLIGPKYQKTTTPASAESAATDPKKAIEEFKASLDKLPNPPVKGADVKCGDADCYSVTVKVSGSDLGSLGGAVASAAPNVTGDGSIELRINKQTLRPSQVIVTFNAGDQGSLTITISLSDYDKAVTIDAPPADQVETAPAP